MSWPNAITVERLDGGPRLVIENARELAFEFFTRDASSVGANSFDAYSGTGDPDRVTVADINAINKTMRARSRLSDWTAFTSMRKPFPFVAELDQKAQLFAIGQRRWIEEYWPERLAGAIENLLGKYRSMSRVTKVLHAKRPGLFPVWSISLAVATGTRRPS